MERFVRLIAPTSRRDFLFKLVFFVLFAGGLNHLRSLLAHGWDGANTFYYNLSAAAFTAVPMSMLSLFLIQHLNRLQRELYQQATRDQLTQLPNRRWFLEKCPKVICRRQVFVLLDLDHFKAVNDAHGHDVGDSCLVAMADHMRNVVPEGVQCARLGGEEFGILFPQGQLGDVQGIVDHICAGIDVTVNHNDIIRITASAGILAVDRDIAFQRAFQLTDAALYQAKAAGRAQYAMAHVTGLNDTAQGRYFSKRVTA